MHRFVVSTFAALLLPLLLTSSVIAARGAVVAARPATVDFHTRQVGTENYKRTKITNTSGGDVSILVSAGLPDDFGFGLLPGSTCPVLAPETLAAGESCYAVVRFSPTEFFAGWEARGSLIVTATDPDTGQELATLVVPVIGTGSL
jgi:hypothetical protein